MGKETGLICTVLDIDPLALIGSGALLITCPKKHVPELTKELDAERIDHAVIGEIREDREDRNLPRVKEDEIWRIMD